MVDAIKPLYTAHGTATGGRNGHTRSDDGIVDLDLSVPKEMGGPGKPNTGTPEHLFAAGYAACSAARSTTPPNNTRRTRRKRRSSAPSGSARARRAGSASRSCST